MNQNFMSKRQLVREDGGSLELGLVKKKLKKTESWGTPVVTGTG